MKKSEDMRSGPPFRGRDGSFHSHGTLEVVSGFLLDRILTLLKDDVSSCCGRYLVIVTPMPRYWIPCCPKGKQLDDVERDSDKRRLLRELNRLRAAISGMVARLRRTDSVQVINPLEALGLHNDLQAIEQVMNGPTHLGTASYRMLADSIGLLSPRTASGASPTQVTVLVAAADLRINFLLPTVLEPGGFGSHIS